MILPFYRAKFGAEEMGFFMRGNFGLFGWVSRSWLDGRGEGFGFTGDGRGLQEERWA